MTGSKRALRMLYREIPATSACRAACMDCCGPVPWSDAEFARVKSDVPATAAWIEVQGVRAMIDALSQRCPFASPTGCKVYDRRPFMCRLFGAANDPQLTCPHGCKAVNPLSARAARALTERYKREDALSGVGP
jgi:Fe-S-cluster containining protein